MPKLELTKEQLANLREAFIFGVEDRAANGLDDEDKAIVAAIDHALVDPRILAARGALGSLPPSDRLLVINSYCLVCGFSLEDGKCVAPACFHSPKPDIPAGLSNLRKQTRDILSSLTPRKQEVLAERFGVTATRYLCACALSGGCPHAHDANHWLDQDTWRCRACEARFHGVDRTKDKGKGTGGGVKERQALLLTVDERELLVELLQRATYEAQQAFLSTNSKTEFIGTKVLVDAQKRVDAVRALLLRAQELINS